MGKMKKVISVSKKAIPVAKKVTPMLSTIVNSMALLENASAIVKPLTDNIMEKSSEKAKRIDAVQTEHDGQVIVKIEKAGVFACAMDETTAFELFLEKLRDLREKKIISSNIKIQKEQVVLIGKLNKILEEEGALENYIYRVLVEESVENEAVDASKKKAKVSLKFNQSFKKRGK